MEWYCKECKFVKVRDTIRDAYFCFTCNKWTESQCSDDECYYCVGRPEKPLTEEEHFEIIGKVVEKMDEVKNHDLEDEIPFDITNLIDIINEVISKNDRDRTVE